jgi:hypothetical protein
VNAIVLESGNPSVLVKKPFLLEFHEVLIVQCFRSDKDLMIPKEIEA